MASYSELMKEYRKFAKRADQRLVRLEAAAITNKNILEWSYKKAMYDIKQYGGSNARRFNIAPPKSKKALERKISVIKEFLKAPTSQVKEIKKIERKRFETLKKSSKMQDVAGLSKISYADWVKLHQSGVFKNLDDKYGFYTAMESLALIERDKNKIKGLIKEAKEENISIAEKLSDDLNGKDYDIVLKETIIDILTKEGLDINTLK